MVTGKVPFRIPLALMLLQLLRLFPVLHVQTAERKPLSPKKKTDKEKEHLSNTTGKLVMHVRFLLKLLQVPGQRLFLPSSWKEVSC